MPELHANIQMILANERVVNLTKYGMTSVTETARNPRTLLRVAVINGQSQLADSEPMPQLSLRSPQPVDVGS